MNNDTYRIWIFLLALLLSTSQLMSQQQDQLVTGTFQNSLNEAAELFHIDETGTATPYGLIQPGESYQQGMYPGNRWEVRVGGQAVAVFVTSTDSNQLFPIQLQNRNQPPSAAPPAMQEAPPRADPEPIVLSPSGNETELIFENGTQTTLKLEGIMGSQTHQDKKYFTYYLPPGTSCGADTFASYEGSWRIFPASFPGELLAKKNVMGETGSQKLLIQSNPEWIKCRVSFDVIDNQNAGILGCRFRSGDEKLKTGTNFGKAYQKIEGNTLQITTAIHHNAILEEAKSQGVEIAPYSQDMLANSFALTPGESYAADFPLVTADTVPAKFAVIDLWTNSGAMLIQNLRVSINNNPPIQFEGQHWIKGTPNLPTTIPATGIELQSISGLWTDANDRSKKFWMIESGNGAKKYLRIAPEGRGDMAVLESAPSTPGTYTYTDTRSVSNGRTVGGHLFNKGTKLVVQGANMAKVELANGHGHIMLTRMESQPFQDHRAEPYRNWVSRQQPPPGYYHEETRFADSFLGSLLGAAELDTLFGYNIVKMQPLNLQNGKGTKIPLFEQIQPDSHDYYKGGTFRVPGHLHYQSENKGAGESRTSTFFSESERIESSGMTVSVSAGAGDSGGGGGGGGGGKGAKAKAAKGGSIGVDYSESEQKKSSLKESEMSTRATKWDGKFWLTMVKEKIPLHPNFMLYMLNDSNFRSEADYIKLFETYGTHYPLSTYFGGMSSLEKQYNASEAMDSFAQSKSITFSGSGTAKGVNVAGSVGFSESSVEVQRNGSTAAGEFFFRTGGAGDYNSLQVDESNAGPIQVVLRPITELLQPEIFGMTYDNTGKALLAKRRAEVGAALARYTDDAASRQVRANLTPRRMKLKVNSLKVTKSDDSGGPDIWGYVDVILQASNEKGRNFRIWHKQGEVEDVNGEFPGIIYPGEFYLPGGRDYNFNLSYDMHINEGDSASAGSSDDDKSDWMYRKQSNLARMNRLGENEKITTEAVRSKIKQEQSADGIGTVLIDVELVELPFSVENPALDLPPFPFLNVR